MNQNQNKDASKLDLIRRLAKELDLNIEIKSKRVVDPRNNCDDCAGEHGAIFSVLRFYERFFGPISIVSGVFVSFILMLRIVMDSVYTYYF